MESVRLLNGCANEALVVKSRLDKKDTFNLMGRNIKMMLVAKEHAAFRGTRRLRDAGRVLENGGDQPWWWERVPCRNREVIRERSCA